MSCFCIIIIIIISDHMIFLMLLEINKHFYFFKDCKLLLIYGLLNVYLFLIVSNCTQNHVPNHLLR